MENSWYLVSSHGAILFYIAVRPGCTINEIADAMSLTRRTVWGVIGDLRRAGMLHVRKEGRRHFYTVNLDAPFKHPVIGGVKLHTILDGLVERASQEDLVALRPHGNGPRRVLVGTRPTPWDFLAP
ncbi:MAG TPA: winged helix-turn-helix domain-containing protein [Candidatus Nanoarchaeia archaeon]